MAHFFKNRSYPQNIVDRTGTRVSARPCMAFISSEPVADIPLSEPSTAPLVLSCHATTQLLKNIISWNFHLLRDDPETAAIFQPLRKLYANRRDQNLRDYLLRSTLANRLQMMRPAVRSPCGRSRCNTCLHTNTHTFLNTPGGHIHFKSKYTCASDNAVYAIKCHTGHKIYIGEPSRRLGDRFR